MAFNSFLNLNSIEAHYETQENQESKMKAMQYTGRIYDSARDMRDQYCRGDFNGACVSAEQLTENALNAVAELNGGLPSKYQNHHTLVDRKKNFCPNLPVSNNSLRRMQKAYSNRYPDPQTKMIRHQYTKEEAKSMICDACDVGDYALDALDISLDERFKQFGEPAEFKSIDDFNLRNILFNGSTKEYCYIL